jgi:hypothetical protein
MIQVIRWLRPVIRQRLLLLAALFLALALTSGLRAAGLAPEDQQFLTAYVQVHDALIANNLAGVVKAANTLPDGSGAALAKAGSLSSARDEFAKLTPRAEKLAAGQPGYHIYYCPMAKKDWVQTGTAIANPYLGADMLTCGVEKK